MPLRPINAIFIEQKQQFFVVYQQGKLWQLPRMKLDMSAWRYRKPYTGNASALVLARDQHIADKALAQKLPTHELPSTLHGISLPRFETWWRQNGFDWLNNSAQATTAQVNVTQSTAQPVGQATKQKTKQETGQKIGQPTKQTVGQTANTTNRQPQKKPSAPSSLNDRPTQSSTATSHALGNQIPQTQSQTQPPPQTNANLNKPQSDDASKTTQASDDIFDNMLADLEGDLLQ